MDIIQLKASRDPLTGQSYVPPRALAADGSLRPAALVEVPARGVLYAATSFHGEHYGIVDLDCGSRVQVHLEAGTDRIGERVAAYAVTDKGHPRYRHD